MDSRRKPPLFSSPDPSRRYSPRSKPRASSARVSPFTRRARRRDSCPSRAWGKRSNNASPATKLRMASPRNSRRSLLRPAKLRWVRARTISSWSLRYSRADAPGDSRKHSRFSHAEFVVELHHQINILDQRLTLLILQMSEELIVLHRHT